MDVRSHSSFPGKYIRAGEISPAPPPPVLKMTVNFHPLLQNGCLMINGGLALRSGTHAAPAHSRPRASAKTPAALRCSAAAQKGAVSLSDGSLEVPLAGGRACVNPLARAYLSRSGSCCQGVMDVSRVFRPHISED